MDRPLAIVTGATQGIGYAVAKTLIQQGYTVYGTYVRDYTQDQLNERIFPGFSLHQVDSSNFDACMEFYQFVQANGLRCSVLVNNAGIVADDLILKMTSQQFERVVSVNLTGTFNMIKVFAKDMMRKKQGVIVNVSSVIGIIGNVGQTNYAASKAGVIGLTKSVAKELAPRNIRVNCVAPGFIETNMTQTLSEDVKQAIIEKTALKKLGTSDDVADAVAFLVSDKSKYITGQVLNVCGGLVI